MMNNKTLSILLLIFVVAFSCENTGKNENKTLSDNELLDTIQKQTVKYFYDFAHPQSGMARERNNEDHYSNDIVTTGGTGFGIMGLVASVDRGFLNRDSVVNLVLKITQFLSTCDRFHGAYGHWYFGSTGKIRPFSKYDNGGDLVETAFLFEGLLTARNYFDADNIKEKKLRDEITNLWEGIEWDFYTNNNPWLLWHWSPDYGFKMNMPLIGFDETQIVYILAASSPTHPIKPELYKTGWASPTGHRTPGAGIYTERLKINKKNNGGGPLFWTHYSYIGMTPYFSDGYVEEAGYKDYFEHNKVMALYNYNFCQKQEHYPENCWGLTSSDDPINGYMWHAPQEDRDNGTIAPTAALSSIPYTPKESLAFARYMWDSIRTETWGEYGFIDAFNLKEDSFIHHYLAIGQGPIIGMIENYRTGLLWNVFMRDKDIRNGIDKLRLVITKNKLDEKNEITMAVCVWSTDDVRSKFGY